jgi:hypothetical protein
LTSLTILVSFEVLFSDWLGKFYRAAGGVSFNSLTYFHQKSLRLAAISFVPLFTVLAIDI